VSGASLVSKEFTDEEASVSYFSSFFACACADDYKTFILALVSGVNLFDSRDKSMI
jgi:hypothetical protein